MTEALAAVAKALLKKIVLDIVLDEKKRRGFLMAVGSISVGLFFLMITPIIFLSAIADIEPPLYSDIEFDREVFLSQLPPEQQEKIAAMEADEQAIAEAMAAIDLQEQTIKAQLIYVSYFEDNRFTDFTAFADHFTQDNEHLIPSLNADYGLAIDYDEFMRTYALVMFTDADVSDPH